MLTLGASLGLIIFTVLIRKSEKQWKVLRDCLKNLPTGIPSGKSDDSQEFPRAASKTQGLMQWDIFTIFDIERIKKYFGLRVSYTGTVW